MERRLLISFSGGETSAYMMQWILNNMRGEYDRMVVVFANTGEENERTLEFVALCEILFQTKIIWVEAVVYPYERRSPGFRIVDYVTASRNGEPFEAGIAKYGIPNSKFMSCTRNLKLNPIRAYARSIGWEIGTYDSAVGIRADEIDRMSSRAQEDRIIYPLVTRHPRKKPQINTWWSAQPFRLGLKGYQGNCRWCWKKSKRKLLTIMLESPEVFAFPERMERQYALVGPEFAKGVAPGYRRTFFRSNQTVADIRAELARLGNSFIPAEDDAVVFDPDLDVGGGCEETCEVFAEEDMAATDDS